MLFAALDALGQCLAIYDASGLLVRQTRAFETLLDSPEGDRIVSAVCTITGGQSIAVGPWVIAASLYQSGGKPSRLVQVARHDDGPLAPSDKELRERFALTRCEVRVARLLADMTPNKLVAASLGVSPHTARHHTEHVMRKLGVRSRNLVAARLFADG